MTSAIILSIALAASEPTAEETIERRAGILTGVGCAFLVGGGVALAGGLQTREPLYDLSAGVLFTVGLGTIVAAVFAWLWPDDEWLGLFALPRPLARPR